MSLERICKKCGAEYDCRHGSKCPSCGSLAATAGSDAAPKVKHGFHIMLTRKQAKELQKIWDAHSENGGMIIMQPVLNWGPFTVKDAFANCAVLNKECALEIQVAIAKAQHQNS